VFFLIFYLFILHFVPFFGNFFFLLCFFSLCVLFYFILFIYFLFFNYFFTNKTLKPLFINACLYL